MPVRKINYPADDGKHNGINQRLSKSHDHDNQDFLSSLSADQFKKFDTSFGTDDLTVATSDLSNVSKENLFNAVKDSTAAIPDVGVINFGDRPSTSNVPNVRMGGKWVKLSDVEGLTYIAAADSHLRVGVASETNVRDDGTQQLTNIYNIALQDETARNIETIPTLANKPTRKSALGNSLVVSDATGKLYRSPLNDGLLVTSDSLESNPEVRGNNVAASATAVNKLYNDIQELSAGISSCRGCVLHAYAESTSALGITSVTITSSGINYTTGDIISIDSPFTLIPAEIIVTEVNGSGGIISVELPESGNGFFSELIQKTGSNYNVCGGSGSGATVTVTIGAIEREPTNLSSLAGTAALGDVVYVMQDETHGFSTTAYIRRVIKNSSGEEQHKWVYLLPLNEGASILRYGTREEG